MQVYSYNLTSRQLWLIITNSQIQCSLASLFISVSIQKYSKPSNDEWSDWCTISNWCESNLLSEVECLFIKCMTFTSCLQKQTASPAHLHSSVLTNVTVLHFSLWKLINWNWNFQHGVRFQYITTVSYFHIYSFNLEVWEGRSGDPA